MYECFFFSRYYLTKFSLCCLFIYVFVLFLMLLFLLERLWPWPTKCCWSVCDRIHIADVGWLFRDTCIHVRVRIRPKIYKTYRQTDTCRVCCRFIRIYVLYMYIYLIYIESKELVVYINYIYIIHTYIDMHICLYIELIFICNSLWSFSYKYV